MTLPTQSSFCDAPKSSTLLLLAHTHVHQQVLYPLLFHYVLQTRCPLPFLHSPYFRRQACSHQGNCLFAISLSTLPSDPKLHESRDHVSFGYCIPSGQITEALKRYEIRHVEIREGTEFRELKARKPESCHTYCVAI